MNPNRRSLIVGSATLVFGVAIGVAVTEIGHANQGHDKTGSATTSVGTPAVTADSSQWNPFQEIQRMQEQMNRSLNEMSAQLQRDDTNQMSLPPAGNRQPMGDSNQWDPFQEIQQMQSQMDQSFDQMFEQFRTQPQFNGLGANYSSSLNIKDLKGRYVVRVFLPDVKTTDVHVTLNNGQTLKIEVNRRESEKKGQINSASQVSEAGQYEQVVQLPAPVKQNEMTVKRDGHDLIITIPKAS